jgi:drug/metabolite transporter (DMT)-like permease
MARALLPSSTTFYYKADPTQDGGSPEGGVAVFKMQDETMELALCMGIVAAVVWGIGVSLYGFYMGPQEISWTAWGAQLLGGILACIAVPIVFVRGREWMVGRQHQGS